MYAFLSDHDMESCKPFLIIVSVIFILLVCPALFFIHELTANFTEHIYHQLDQPCSPQCLFVLRAYAITGAKRWTLFIYLPCLFGYLFIVCWHTLNEMALWKEAFLILGRTACFRALYDRYGSYFVCFICFVALRSWPTDPISFSSADARKMHLALCPKSQLMRWAFSP